jgi:alcohol dehydrogenase (cytochrome c)
VKHQGNAPRTRGVALWEDLVIANLPDGRVIAIKRDNGEIVWDKMVAATNEFGNKEKFVTAPITAENKVIIANGAGDAGTRGWVAALEARTGKELWRWYVVPKPGDPGSETWKDKNNSWKTGGGGIWQTGSYDPATRFTIWGWKRRCRNTILVASGRQPLYRFSRRSTRHRKLYFQYAERSWTTTRLAFHAL